MYQEFIIQVLGILFVFLLLYVAISYAISPRKTFGNIQSRWHHTFDDMQFQTKEVYTAIEAAIQETGINKTDVDRVTYSESGVLSSSRIYLQVRRGDQMFLICAAQIAKGYFISWWFGETLSFFKDFIPRIPKYGPKLAEIMFSKTFYQMDTDSMFKDIVKNCVLRVVDDISNAKGIRLTELQRMETNTSSK